MELLETLLLNVCWRTALPVPMWKLQMSFHSNRFLLLFLFYKSNSIYISLRSISYFHFDEWNSSKVKVEIFMLHNNSNWNKCFSFYSQQMYYSFHWNIKQHNFSTLSQYDKFLKHNIKMKMISEGSCDTEDWSNDAEHVPLPLQKYNTFVNILKQNTIILVSRFLSKT